MDKVKEYINNIVNRVKANPAIVRAGLVLLVSFGILVMSDVQVDALNAIIIALLAGSAAGAPKAAKVTKKNVVKAQNRMNHLAHPEESDAIQQKLADLEAELDMDPIVIADGKTYQPISDLNEESNYSKDSDLPYHGE